MTAKHVFRYLHGTIGYGLHYSVDNDMHLVGYWVQEYFRVLLQFGICCYFLVQQEVDFCSVEFRGSGVHCSVYGSSGSCVVAEATC